MITKYNYKKAGLLNTYTVIDEIAMMIKLINAELASHAMS